MPPAPFLRRPPERGAVGIGRAKVGVPGVEVGVELQHRDGTMPRVLDAQQRQGDRVVAAEGSSRND
jgi:hypothetical protein